MANICKCCIEFKGENLKSLPLFLAKYNEDNFLRKDVFLKNDVLYFLTETKWCPPENLLSYLESLKNVDMRIEYTIECEKHVIKTLKDGLYTEILSEGDPMYPDTSFTFEFWLNDASEIKYDYKIVVPELILHKEGMIGIDLDLPTCDPVSFFNEFFKWFSPKGEYVDNVKRIVMEKLKKEKKVNYKDENMIIKLNLY